LKPAQQPCLIVIPLGYPRRFAAASLKRAFRRPVPRVDAVLSAAIRRGFIEASLSGVSPS